MTRSLGIAACLVLLAAPIGCSKGKKSSTAPGQKVAKTPGSGKDPKSLEDLDPTKDPGARDPHKATDPAKPDAQKSGPGDPDAKGPAGPDVAKQPEIKPPDLDLSPEQARKKVDAHLTKGRRYLNADPNVTIAEAKAALKWAPHNIDAVVLLAQAYYNKKLYDTAEVLLDLVLRDHTKKALAERNAKFFHTQGLIYDQTNRPKLAIRSYAQSVRIDASFGPARVNLGAHLLRNKAYPDAVQHLEYAVNTLNMKGARSYNLLGAAYRGRASSAGNSEDTRKALLQKALTAFNRARNADKNYAPVYYNLGVLYFDAKSFPLGNGTLDELQRLERAKTYFEEYMRLPGADVQLATKRLKAVNRVIKREQRKRARQKKQTAKPATNNP